MDMSDTQMRSNDVFPDEERFPNFILQFQQMLPYRTAFASVAEPNISLHFENGEFVVMIVQCFS